MGASAIVDTGPGTGVELAESVRTARVPDAPAKASEVMDDVTGMQNCPRT